MCAATWKSRPAADGSPGVCQDGTPTPAERHFNGLAWCGACFLDVVKMARARSGRNPALVKLAVKVIGKDGNQAGVDRLHAIAQGRLKGAMRNQPCGCGSGKKAKKCHPDGVTA